MLIVGGADINTLNDFNDTALSIAVSKRKHELAKILVKKGAYIFFKDMAIRDFSPFFRAIRCENLDAIELFCDCGVDLNIQS